MTGTNRIAGTAPFAQPCSSHLPEHGGVVRGAPTSSRTTAQQTANAPTASDRLRYQGWLASNTFCAVGPNRWLLWMTRQADFDGKGHGGQKDFSPRGFLLGSRVLGQVFPTAARL